MSHRTFGGSFSDDFEDDDLEGGTPADPFADVRDDEPAASTDPFDLEPVLEDDYQNEPNSYNVRNIMLIAAGGFVLILVVFLFSVGGSQADPGLEVADGLGAAPAEATPPDLSLRPVEAGMVPDEDLMAALDDPVLAQGGYGSYRSSAPPPRTAAPRGGGSAGSGDREPSYLDRRRDAFLAALGRPRQLSTPPEVPDNVGGPSYVVDAAGNVLSVAPDYHVAQTSAQTGARAPQWSGGVGGSSAGAMRAAEVQAQPRFSPFTLHQGVIVSVVLETAVDSDAPGLVTFRTTADVYDRHRRYVLIPRGSQIVASSGEVVGDRLHLEAVRLNVPDGRSVDFAGAALHDAQGRLGLTDIVDRHTLSRVGAGALQAATGVASAVAGRRAGRSTVIIRNADGSISEVPVADDIQEEAARRGTRGAERAVGSATDRALRRANTVRLRSGLRAVVVIGQDVDLGGPYYQTGAVPTGRSPYDVRPQAGGQAGPPVPAGRPRVPPPPPVRTPVRTAANR